MKPAHLFAICSYTLLASDTSSRVVVVDVGCQCLLGQLRGQNRDEEVSGLFAEYLLLS